MKKIQLILVLLFLLCSAIVFGQTSNKKEKGVQHFRDFYTTHVYKGYQLKRIAPLEKCLEDLQKDGHFASLKKLEDKIISEKSYLIPSQKKQSKVGTLNAKAFGMIWKISEGVRSNEFSKRDLKKIYPKLYSAILFYGGIERERGTISTGRFHASCFAIPVAAVNTYFVLIDQMNAVEKGKEKSKTLVAVNKMLKELSFQSWTQPYRNDETDNNVVSVARFRGHVWWVGGNALGYRALLPTAAAMSSAAMIDVLAEVSGKALSVVAQNTIDTDFWIEGFTADGAGWGHGRQSIVWGYPIDGTLAALELLYRFQKTPWEQSLSEKGKDAIFNYLRGSSWYYCRGFYPYGLGRGGMQYFGDKKQVIKSQKIASTLLRSWRSSFSKSEIKELESFASHATKKSMVATLPKDGTYQGVRWFYNNDDLIKKNKDYYIFVNMSSVRSDGTESAPNMADAYNFFTDVGSTVLWKKGDEYTQAMGAWDMSSIPGTTARQGMSALHPITNWSGYISHKNFAGAATDHSGAAFAGYDLEYMNAKKRGEKNFKDSNNPTLYDVVAKKSYFMFGDYMLALGSGIENQNSSLDGNIWTTIDQTSWKNKASFFTVGSVNTSASSKVSNGSFKYNWKSNKGESFVSEQVDGFAYKVIGDQTTGEVRLDCGSRATAWKKINATNKKKQNLPTKADIFHLVIDHGKEVKDGTYGYLVYAGEKTGKDAFSKQVVEVISNTTSLQAAQDAHHTALGAAFYTKDAVLKSATLEISVSDQAVVLLYAKAGELFLSLTDPTMDKNKDEISVVLDGEFSGKHFNKQKVTVQLPKGHQSGDCVITKL
ncbi:hypothetical protein K5X82_09190 [Halosquirtibacter xylanolyticus]|uniref:polysaccharide lyase family 8 super-sandwich domain-containing protein n=1 Tax=Halosquirtibacter xylanolyticus TaxID=3374599 RepID=UPI003748673E|nr:hypothetical protein K5X82_09190 [Prolixibacteraceae bacterium]